LNGCIVHVSSAFVKGFFKYFFIFFGFRYPAEKTGCQVKSAPHTRQPTEKQPSTTDSQKILTFPLVSGAQMWYTESDRYM